MFTQSKQMYGHGDQWQCRPNIGTFPTPSNGVNRIEKKNQHTIVTTASTIIRTRSLSCVCVVSVFACGGSSKQKQPHPEAHSKEVKEVRRRRSSCSLCVFVCCVVLDHLWLLSYGSVDLHKPAASVFVQGAPSSKPVTGVATRAYAVIIILFVVTQCVCGVRAGTGCHSHTHNTHHQPPRRRRVKKNMNLVCVCLL